MTRDLRKYAQQTNVRLAIAAFLALYLVGTLLIGIFYGVGAAIMGFLCLLGALLPVVLIFLALKGMEWINERANRE